MLSVVSVGHSVKHASHIGCAFSVHKGITWFMKMQRLSAKDQVSVWSVAVIVTVASFLASIACVVMQGSSLSVPPENASVRKE